MILTAEEARRLTGSQLHYICEKISAQALRGLHFIHFDYFLNTETRDTLKELGYDITEETDNIYEETPYNSTDKIIGEHERTTIRW